MDEVHNLLRYLLAIAHLRGFCITDGRLFVGVGGSISELSLAGVLRVL